MHPTNQHTDEQLNEIFYEVVRRIPTGQVATYAQIASLADWSHDVRQVGYALSAVNDPSVPWHRVVKTSGEIAQRTQPRARDQQRELLVAEGVTFKADYCIDMQKHGWQETPPDLFG